MSLRAVKEKLGAAAVALVLIALAGLVIWNVFGQGPYGDSCRVSLGCRSYLCLEHGLAGSEQIAANGRCTKACSDDAACGSEYRCVTLSAQSRADLPPFGVPSRVCMRVLED